MKVTVSEGQVGGGTVKDSLSAAVCVCVCMSGRVVTSLLCTAKMGKNLAVLVAL